MSGQIFPASACSRTRNYISPWPLLSCSCFRLSRSKKCTAGLAKLWRDLPHSNMFPIEHKMTVNLIILPAVRFQIISGFQKGHRRHRVLLPTLQRGLLLQRRREMSGPLIERSGLVMSIWQSSVPVARIRTAAIRRTMTRINDAALTTGAKCFLSSNFGVSLSDLPVRSRPRPPRRWHPPLHRLNHQGRGDHQPEQPSLLSVLVTMYELLCKAAAPTGHQLSPLQQMIRRLIV